MGFGPWPPPKVLAFGGGRTIHMGHGDGLATSKGQNSLLLLLFILFFSAMEWPNHPRLSHSLCQNGGGQGSHPSSFFLSSFFLNFLIFFFKKKVIFFN
jgi:hypothetical protein